MSTYSELNNNRMQVSLEAYGRKTTIEIGDEASMRELLDVFHALALAASWQDASWRNEVIDLANEYMAEERAVEVAESTSCECCDCGKAREWE